jgi:hypothetical protein
MAELVRGVAGWAAASPFSGHIIPREEFEAIDPLYQRELIAKSLKTALPLLQPGACEILAEALDALEDGRIAPLLKPAKHAIQGKQPRRVAQLRLEILAWIKWQTASGRPYTEVLREAADAVGRGPSAIEKWRSGLEVVLGMKPVYLTLTGAENAGRSQQTGRRRDISTEGHLRRLESRPLADLAAELRAIGKRTPPRRVSDHAAGTARSGEPRGKSTGEK